VSLAPLHGHERVRRALASALKRGRLAQSLLIHGQAGIGKERLGLWLGQLLLCDAPGDEPCGQCSSCRTAARLEHPDLHWFFPLPRPDATSPERLREKLEEARAEELQARRANPAHVPSFEKPPAYYVAAMQTVQEAAVRRPAAGHRKVFVFGDAERMVPQESSPEAANALLKLLEEPPADTTLILTSSVPDELLPTIRSRVLPVRLLPLAREEVAAYLTAYADAPPILQRRGRRRRRGGRAGPAARGACGRPDRSPRGRAQRGAVGGARRLPGPSGRSGAAAPRRARPRLRDHGG
jgi:DNA polymerase-3 subunit delta'